MPGFLMAAWGGCSVCYKNNFKRFICSKVHQRNVRSALAREKINRANKKNKLILLSCISAAILLSLGSFETIMMQADGKEVKFAAAPNPTLKKDRNTHRKRKSLAHQAIIHNKILLYYGCHLLVVSYIAVSIVYSRKLSAASSQIKVFA